MDGKKRIRVLLPLLFFILLSLVLFLVFNGKKEEGDRVRVSVDGRMIGEYLLGEDREVVLNGGTNILLIKDGKACIEDADCPDRICVKEGWVSRTGECITCLPNRLIVEVVKLNDSVDLVV